MSKTKVRYKVKRTFDEKTNKTSKRASIIKALKALISNNEEYMDQPVNVDDVNFFKYNFNNIIKDENAVKINEKAIEQSYQVYKEAAVEHNSIKRSDDKNKEIDSDLEIGH